MKIRNVSVSIFDEIEKIVKIGKFLPIFKKGKCNSRDDYPICFHFRLINDSFTC